MGEGVDAEWQQHQTYYHQETNKLIKPELLTRLQRWKPSVVAAMLRMGRRIEEGFEGEIVVAVKAGGVHYIRWTHTETGEMIREELE